MMRFLKKIYFWFNPWRCSKCGSKNLRCSAMSVWVDLIECKDCDWKSYD